MVRSPACLYSPPPAERCFDPHQYDGNELHSRLTVPNKTVIIQIIPLSSDGKLHISLREGLSFRRRFPGRDIYRQQWHCLVE